jgi:uncharacterized protein YciI
MRFILGRAWARDLDDEHHGTEFEMRSNSGHFLVELTLKGPLTAEELDAQRAFLRRLTDDGVLVMAAVVPAVVGRGLAVVMADTLEDAITLYNAAPVVVNGKASVEVQALRITAGILSR